MGRKDGQQLVAPYVRGMFRKKVFTPPDTPEDCKREKIFVGKVAGRSSACGQTTRYECGDLNRGWWLAKQRKTKDGELELTYATSRGQVLEKYSANGRLREQFWLNTRRQNLDDWAEKYWHATGKLASREKYIPAGDKVGLARAIEDLGGKLLISESFNREGQKEAERYLTTDGGHIFDVTERQDTAYGTLGMTSTILGGSICAPENSPCQYFVTGDELKSAKYKTFVGGKIVLHRTDGPAIIDNHAPKGKQERYFLSGEEYSRRQWEKKTGRRIGLLSSFRGN